MTPTDYAINIVLVLLVFIQVRDRRLSLKSSLFPVCAVVFITTFYLPNFPTRGHDVALDVLLGAVGLTLGLGAAMTTRVWRASDGMAHSKAGVVAAALWIIGLGSRMVFEIYATHGGASAVTNFSIRNQISGSDAWLTALVIMGLAEVLSRTVVLRLRGANAPAPATAALPHRVPAGVR